jgi:hypothetical protein
MPNPENLAAMVLAGLELFAVSAAVFTLGVILICLAH